MTEIAAKHALFPNRLNRLHQPPERIFMMGEGLNKLMQRPRLAVVGARRATPYGRSVTLQFVHQIAAAGVVIVSGLAFGIDGVAHQAALEVGGDTIAVLAGGLDRIYPTANIRLANTMLRGGGVLLSEYPAGTPSYKHNFVARNRIIACLSDAVLITEAALKSGSLHTAGFARDLGIPVMVIPGPITSDLSVGTNNLITQGAIPVMSADDVLYTMGLMTPGGAQAKLFADSPEEMTILQLLKQGISDGAELLRQSGLDTAQFNQTLTMLEVTGRVRPLGANYWQLR